MTFGLLQKCQQISQGHNLETNDDKIYLHLNHTYSTVRQHILHQSSSFEGNDKNELSEGFIIQSKLNFMGGCYTAVEEKQHKILEPKAVQPHHQPFNQPNPEKEEDIPQDKPLAHSIIYSAPADQEAEDIKKQLPKESCYYSKINRHSKEQLNVCEPSQAAISVIQRLQVQDPDSVFFKGIPRNLDKSYALSKASKIQSAANSSQCLPKQVPSLIEIPQD